MEQLRMKCNSIKPAAVNLKDGFSIIDSSSPCYSADDFSKQWAAICEELNEKYDETLYRSMMLADPLVPDDAILFVRDPEGLLISTATVLLTEDPNVAVLHMVGTRREAKGFGAGGAVCAACINYATQHGITRMRLKTDEFRLPAIKIYLRLGFLPDLFQADMRERWIGVMKDLQLKEFDAVNENGGVEKIII